MTLPAVDGLPYVTPGMGVTTASTPLRVTRSLATIRASTRALAGVVFNPSNQFKQDCLCLGIPDPEFRLGVTVRGMAIHEVTGNKAFVLPRRATECQPNWLTELHDLLVPEWVLRFLRHCNERSDRVGCGEVQIKQ